MQANELKEIPRAYAEANKNRHWSGSLRRIRKPDLPRPTESMDIDCKRSPRTPVSLCDGEPKTQENRETELLMSHCKTPMSLTASAI